MNDDDTDQGPVDRLARFTSEHFGETEGDAIRGLLLALIDEAHDEDDEVTSADALAGLALIPGERDQLDDAELRFIEAYMDRGGTWTSAAAALGTTAGALRQRYRRLGGTRTWAPGRPRTTDPDQPLLASREQAEQWRQDTLDRLSQHPEIVATANPDAPGYWAVRTPDGAALDEVMGDVLADLHARGVRITRPDGTPLDAFDWHTASRA